METNSRIEQSTKADISFNKAVNDAVLLKFDYMVKHESIEIESLKLIFDLIYKGDVNTDHFGGQRYINDIESAIKNMSLESIKALSQSLYDSGDLNLHFLAFDGIIIEKRQAIDVDEETDEPIEPIEVPVCEIEYTNLDIIENIKISVANGNLNHRRLCALKNTLYESGETYSLSLDELMNKIKFAIDDMSSKQLDEFKTIMYTKSDATRTIAGILWNNEKPVMKSSVDPKTPKDPSSPVVKKAPKSDAGLTEMQQTLFDEITNLTNNNVKFITANMIAEKLNLSIFTVSGSMSTLASRGFVKIEKITGHQKKIITLNQ